MSQRTRSKSSFVVHEPVSPCRRGGDGEGGVAIDGPFDRGNKGTPMSGPLSCGRGDATGSPGFAHDRQAITSLTEARPSVVDAPAWSATLSTRSASSCVATLTLDDLLNMEHVHLHTVESSRVVQISTMPVAPHTTDLLMTDPPAFFLPLMSRDAGI